MRAISQNSFGGPDVLTEVELDRPVPGPTEVLVRVSAAGINPVDWKTRSQGGLGTLGDPPFVLGWDVSGVVADVGLGVTLFRPGDAVFGMPRFPRQAGAYAEYLTAPARQLAPKPDELDHVDAAALPLAGLTAWQILIDTADVQPGHRVLIHAASGGVGHLAVQIAKARGAHVIGTARAEKHDFLRGLGADELVDYTTTDFAEAVHNVDLVVDGIGGEYSERSLRTLRPGGLLIPVPGPVNAAVAATADARGIRTSFALVEPDRAGLLGLSALVREGKLRVEVDSTFPLAEAAKAHELGESLRTRGKLVLTVTA